MNQRTIDILLASLLALIAAMLATFGRPEFIAPAIAGVTITGLLLFGNHDGRN